MIVHKNVYLFFLIIHDFCINKQKYKKGDKKYEKELFRDYDGHC